MGEAYLGSTRRAVTKITLYPLTVTKQITQDKAGYQATQVKFGKKFVKEIPYLEEAKVGQELTPELNPGSLFSVQGTTKGKGFAGVIKRWGFGGGFKTHGQSDRHRAPGSIGQGTTPGRVHKGKKMAGHMGTDTHSVKKAQLVMVSGNDIWVTGPVPGHNGTLLRLTLTGSKDLPKVSFVTGGLPEKPKNNQLDNEPAATQDDPKQESVKE